MHLELTQAQMIDKLGVRDEPLQPASISAYEKNLREPPLIVLLRYARVYGCTMEELVDDNLKLPGSHKPGQLPPAVAGGFLLYGQRRRPSSFDGYGAAPFAEK